MLPTYQSLVLQFEQPQSLLKDLDLTRKVGDLLMELSLHLSVPALMKPLMLQSKMSSIFIGQEMLAPIQYQVKWMLRKNRNENIEMEYRGLRRSGRKKSEHLGRRCANISEKIREARLSWF